MSDVAVSEDGIKGQVVVVGPDDRLVVLMKTSDQAVVQAVSDALNRLLGEGRHILISGEGVVTVASVKALLAAGDSDE